MRRPLLACLLLLSLAACASDTKGEAASSSTVGTTSTSSAPVVTGSVTFTPSGGCPDGLTPMQGSPPPSQGAALTNGRYFAFLSSVDASGRSVTVDIAQFLTGEAANQAATADGEESPPSNDYYIRNQSKATRTIAVTADAAICAGTNAGDVHLHPVDLHGLVTAVKDYPGNQGLLVWIEVIGGAVTRVEQQYVP